MPPPRTIRTERLLLRRWLPEDLEAFAAINADPRVTEFLPTRLSRQESRAWMERNDAHFEEHGFGRWAVEVPGVAPFIGFAGLGTPRFPAPFQPQIEIGWRFGAEHWGRGYATESARATLAFGFDAVGLEEIVSITVPQNVRSRHVMEKIGMTRDPADDFDHPLLAEGHPLRRHVLYRIRRPR